MGVVVAGGGIAGLVTALTCHQIGVPVRVFEAVADLRPLGVGIDLQPNAVRELVDLGLGDELASIGVSMREWAMVDRDGVELWAEPRGIDAGYRWPQIAVHRGALQMMLLQAVEDRLGSHAVVTGHSVTAYEHALDSVRVQVTDSTGGTSWVDADVLVGADGFHSAVRSQMFPGEAGPRWGGGVLWRGTVLAQPIRTGASYLAVGAEEKCLMLFPISAPDPVTGLQTQNWLAEVTHDPHRGWRRGDWNTRVGLEEFIDEFDGWTAEQVDLPALLGRTEEIYEFPMVDRDPVDHWIHGSVALVGDAAHLMYPFGSNGASQAIVDARVLGSMFVVHGVGRSALQGYQAALHGPVSELVLRNRTAGPLAILGVIGERPDVAFDDRDAIERFMHSYRAAAGNAIETLNQAAQTIASGDTVTA